MRRIAAMHESVIGPEAAMPRNLPYVRYGRQTGRACSRSLTARSTARRIAADGGSTGSR